MKEINTEELKQIQMDILTDVDSFCNENGINYSIAGGTFIGAVRHKGYIPWDDDIDIFMYRDDYDKFVRIFPDKYKGYLQVKCLSKNPDYWNAYANICDTRTRLIEDVNIEESCVNIDLFPIDDVPDNEKEWQKYKRGMYLRQLLRDVKIVHNGNYTSAFHNTLLVIMKILLCPFNLNFFVRIMDKYAQKCNGKGYKSVYFNCFGVYGKHPFHKSVFKEFQYYPFEDRQYKGFKDYDDYLRNTFGDYMTPPSIDKQVTHHKFKAYWKDND